MDYNDADPAKKLDLLNDAWSQLGAWNKMEIYIFKMMTKSLNEDFASKTSWEPIHSHKEGFLRSGEVRVESLWK